MDLELEHRDPIRNTILIGIIVLTIAAMSFGIPESSVPTKVEVSEFRESQVSDTVAGNVWRQFGVRRITEGKFSFQEILRFIESDIRSVRIHQGPKLGDWRASSAVESRRQARSNRLWLMITFKDGSSATLHFDGVAI